MQCVSRYENDDGNDTERTNPLHSSTCGMTNKRRSTSAHSSSAHLPILWPDQAEYDSFCKLVNPWTDYTEVVFKWQEIRIPSASSAEDVYRRLPSDMDIEFGGYLTQTRIRYVAGGRRQAWVPQSKACTFHSHPTRIQRIEPDVPSAGDIRHFLSGRHWRTITVGRSLLWVWDKTARTRNVMRKLWEWESKNMVREVRRLMQSFPDDWLTRYYHLAIEKLGVRLPQNNQRWARIWPEQLQTKLGFKVTVLERDGEVTRR